VPIASFAVQSSVPEVSRVDHFIGPSEELDAIHRELEHDGSRKTAVVHGLGGMGKTQLALAYAQRHKEEYSAVFWINSKDVDTLGQTYATAARRIYRDHPSLVHLKTVTEGSDVDEAAEAVKLWLRTLGTTGAWLSSTTTTRQSCQGMMSRVRSIFGRSSLKQTTEPY
jgi:hypothetical protein